MRTPDDDRARARDLYASARATTRADKGLVDAPRVMELEAGAKLPGCGAIPNRIAIDRASPGLVCPARSVSAERSRYGRGQWAC
jgi:hypothetical protein